MAKQITSQGTVYETERTKPKPFSHYTQFFSGSMRVSEWMDYFDVSESKALKLMRQRYKEAVEDIQAVTAQTRLWRCIALQPRKRPAALKTLGIYWATKPSAAVCHWGGGPVEYIFEVEVSDPSNVDVNTTMEHRMVPSTGGEEHEINLREGGKVWLERIIYPDGREKAVGKWAVI